MRRAASLAFIVLLAAAIVAGALLAAGKDPFVAGRLLIEGALGSSSSLQGSLRETAPLLLGGLAAFVALRAGLFNIGVDGQLTVGALASAAVAIRVSGPAGIAAGALAGAAAGGLWALPAGLIRAYRGGNEVISTIMLNRIAGLGANALVAGALRDPSAGSATTATLSGATRISPLSAGGVEYSPVLLVGAALVALAAWAFSQTVAGYEMRAVGEAPRAAEHAGVDARRAMVRAMLVSGAVAGLGGAFQVLAYEGRFYADFSPGYGFNSLGVALLAGPSALALLPAAFAFGVLQKGGVALAAEGIDRGITDVVLGGLILVVGVIRFARGRAGREAVG